jgi:hypothetical protein
VYWVAVNRGDGVQEQMNAGVVVCVGVVCVRGIGRGARDGVVGLAKHLIEPGAIIASVLSGLAP